MNVPEELWYSSDHEWVRLQNGSAVVGITDYAQDALGDIVFIQLPPSGTAVKTGDKLGEIESTKSVSEIYAPVSGTVVTVNEALTDEPELVNRDPYGDGWLLTVELSKEGEQKALLDAAAYQALLEG
jgi:glycine cleavage system H protein